MRYSDPRPTAVCDSECYINYWSIAFQDVESGRIRLFEKWNDSELDTKGIAKIFKNWRIVTFNGINYDMPMIALAMTGASNADLKRASDDIIIADLRPWQFYERYNVKLPEWIDHIDLAEVSPGSPQKPSLKVYAGRLHYKTMIDLPFDPSDRITPEKREMMVKYLDNDLGVTRAFYKELLPGIELRALMSDEYNIDLRSKSGPQVGEAVIKAEVEKITKRRLYRPDAKPHTFHYDAPSYLTFETAQLQRAYDLVTQKPFVVTSKFEVTGPPELDDLKITIGGTTYTMGIGGLHSTESSVSYFADDEYEIIDADVASYYPSLILNAGYVPKHIGDAFVRVYRKIYKDRLAAKALGQKIEKQLKVLEAKIKALELAIDALEASDDPALRAHVAGLKKQLKAAKDKAESLKLTLNGIYGKLGSQFSVVYSPKLMIQTTISGQLSILMLIERLHCAGFQVISANTDGFITKVLRSRRTEYDIILMDWEFDTMLELEKTFYKSLHSRDVNNFMAIGIDGKVKTKGSYAPAGPGLRGADGMKKNPNCEITIDAVVALLKDGKPLEQTIHECRDITKFVTIRKVKGGAVDQEGNYLGKAIRWAYGKGSRGPLTYKESGNAVPKSEGALAMMTLPDEFPSTIDHDWYIREATAILKELGLAVLDPSLKGRKGSMLAKMSDKKTYHEVHLPTGIAACGATPASIRDRWEEVDAVPLGYRLCTKCKKASEL